MGNSMSQFPVLLQVMRPYQWSKNVLLFLPCIAAQDFLFRQFFFLHSIFSFSLTASGVYILNDIRDLRSDRLHPTKIEPFPKFKSGDWLIYYTIFYRCGFNICGFCISFVGSSIVSYFSNLLYTLVLKVAFCRYICSFRFTPQEFLRVVTLLGLRSARG